MKLGDPTVVTLGNFDGVHVGHQQMIRETLIYAKANNLHPLLLTFDPHPVEVIQKIKIKKLLTLERRQEFIRQAGMQDLECICFDEALSRKSAEYFIDELIRRYNMKALVVGPTAHIGKNREGTPKVLEALMHDRGLRFKIVPPLTQEGELVSSSMIRALISKGDVISAQKYLGRMHETEGPTVKGHGLGRAFGFSTINVSDPGTLAPGRGVYITETKIHETLFPSITNVGVRPTIHEASPEIIETHLLLDGQIRDGEDLPDKIRILWHVRLRDERKFNSLDDLKNQIAEDVLAARLFFKNRLQRT